jgi:hypothetical protein
MWLFPNVSSVFEPEYEFQFRGWARGRLPFPVKHMLVVEPFKEISGRKRDWKRNFFQNKDYEFGTWNVKSTFYTWNAKSLIQQLKDYGIKITTIKETNWKEKGITYLGIYFISYGGKDIKKREFEDAFVVDTSLKGNIIDFKRISDRICVYLSNSILNIKLLGL